MFTPAAHDRNRISGLVAVLPIRVLCTHSRWSQIPEKNIYYTRFDERIRSSKEKFACTSRFDNKNITTVPSSFGYIIFIVIKTRFLPCEPNQVCEVRLGTLYYDFKANFIYFFFVTYRKFSLQYFSHNVRLRYCVYPYIIFP